MYVFVSVYHKQLLRLVVKDSGLVKIVTISKISCISYKIFVRTDLGNYLVKFV